MLTILTVKTKELPEAPYLLGTFMKLTLKLFTYFLQEERSCKKIID